MVAPRTKLQTIADVYIDGHFIKHLTLRTNVGASRMVVITRTFASSGTHTVELRVHGGTRRWVQFDAFVVTK